MTGPEVWAAGGGVFAVGVMGAVGFALMLRMLLSVLHTIWSYAFG